MQQEEARGVALREQRMTEWIRVLCEAKEVMYSKDELDLGTQDADLLLWVDDRLSAARKELERKLKF